MSAELITGRLSGTIWRRELVEFAQRRRALVVKLVFPLLAGMPLILSRAPSFYAATALTMLVAVIGALGSGAVLTRERGSGLTLRYRLLPLRPARLLIERLAANAFIDLLQLLLVIAVIAARHPAGWNWWAALLLSTAAVLLWGNVLGAWASTLSTSPGEVMLYIFFPLLPALFLSGVFIPLTEPLATVSRLLPFTYLHDALVGALGGSPLFNPWLDLAAAAAFLAAAVLAGSALARRVLETD